ncbi:hypothetical protein [Umezawaea beigongshangensis]|uniref:hypothetical protein n=1 Tax=Umezawaea beigongshangensis TaxID=2780383 RepID=UPI0018F16606|nr:hypothetical protein [Umezawaea beigongshangensis]
MAKHQRVDTGEEPLTYLDPNTAELTAGQRMQLEMLATRPADRTSPVRLFGTDLHVSDADLRTWLAARR